MTVEELIRLSMKAGEMALAVMKTLDEANTQTYGNPTPHAVSTTLKAGLSLLFPDTIFMIWKCCCSKAQEPA